MLIDDFKVIFPQFDATLVDTLWPNLELQWPCYYNFPYVVGSYNAQAILNLVAHLFLIESRISGDGQSKPPSPIQAVQSKSVGNVSVSYVATAPSLSPTDTFFASTIYGQRYLQLIKSRMGAVFV